MAVVAAPALAVASVHAVVLSAFGGQSAGLTLSSVHDLDVSADAVYNGFLTARSANRSVQLTGELGKGSFANLARATRVGVFEVVDKVKPVVVTSVRGGLAGYFSLLFYDSVNDVVNARSLFANGQVVELRACPEPLLENSWIVVTEVLESRLSYYDWARKFDIQFTQTTAP